MNHRALLILFLLSSSLCGQATQVLFPLSQMFATTNYANSFQITAGAPLVTDGTRVYVGTFINVTPTPGVDPVVSLTPNNYLVKFPDATTPLRFSVTNSTSVLNLLTLISGPLPTFNYMPQYTATNLDGAATNQVIALIAEYAPAGGGSATNVFFGPGQSTSPRIVNGTNVFDVTGPLTNNTTGSAAMATNAASGGDIVTNGNNTVFLNGVGTLTNYQALRRAMLGGLQGNPPTIVLVGDSHVVGFGAGYGAAGQPGYTNAASYNITRRLSGLLGGPDEGNLGIYHSLTPAIYNPLTYDPRILTNNLASDFAGYNYIVPGGSAGDMTSAGDYVWQTIHPVNKLLVFFSANPGNGTFNVLVDGVTNYTVSQASFGTTAIAATNLVIANGTHTIDIRWQSGFVDIYGLVCLDTNAPVNIVNAGWDGSTMAEWCNSNNAPYAPWPGLGAELALLPNPILINEGGGNDSQVGESIATMSNYFNIFFTGLPSTVPVLQVTTVPVLGFDFETNGLSTVQQQVAQGVFSEGYLDLARLWGFGQTGPAAQNYYNAYHPSTTGYADIAERIAQVLTGGSSYPSTNFTGSFTGPAAGLTGIPASQLTGSVPAAALPGQTYTNSFQPTNANLSLWTGFTPTTFGQAMTNAFDATNAALNALKTATNSFQPTNANLSLWTGFTPTTFGQAMTNAFDATNAAFNALKTATNSFQPTNANLSLWTGFTPTTFGQAMTNAFQPTNAALSVLGANNGAALTNVAATNLLGGYVVINATAGSTNFAMPLNGGRFIFTLTNNAALTNFIPSANLTYGTLVITNGTASAKTLYINAAGTAQKTSTNALSVAGGAEVYLWGDAPPGATNYFN